MDFVIIIKIFSASPHGVVFFMFSGFMFRTPGCAWKPFGVPEIE